MTEAAVVEFVIQDVRLEEVEPMAYRFLPDTAVTT